MIAHPSRLALEELRLGAGSAEAAEHLQHCLPCREMLQAMEAEDRAFMIARPHLGSLGIPLPKKRRWLAPVMALAACSLALLLALPDPQTAETTRSKGSSHVELLVRRGAATFTYDDRPLHPGDTLLFRYTSTRRHMLLASVEASGEVSIFADAAIEPGQNRFAPQAVKLDDYLGEERIVVVLSDDPLDPEAVKQALARASPPEGGETVSWVIEKEQE